MAQCTFLVIQKTAGRFHAKKIAVAQESGNSHWGFGKMAVYAQVYRQILEYGEKCMKQKVKLCTTVLLVVSLLGGCAEHPDDTGISTSDSNAMTIAASYPQDRLVATMVSSAVPDSSAFVPVSEFAPSVEISLQYATVNNFTEQKIYDFTDAYLRYGTVQKLKAAADVLESQGFGIKLWDAFRPVSAQEKLYEAYPDSSVVSHPVTGYRGHCRGNAVDVTLIDLATGEELAMPTGFDNFTAYADRDYSDCGVAAASNAQILESVMTKCGFKPLQSEWWHFTDTDTYPVDEYFEPGTPMVWEANCNEYISLRKTAGGSEVLEKIPAGATVILRSWNGRYANVSYGDKEGYVLSSYIKPHDSTYLSNSLSLVTWESYYTYEQMQADIAQMSQIYPNVLAVSTIGTSELGREIPVLRIGNENARYHILFQGAIHGREHMTAWLLMALTDYWLARDIQSYGDVCYHIIPMLNPDGVTISQTATLTPQQESIYQKDKEKGYTSLSQSEYATAWKANGLGTDLNRNFPSGWESITARDAASSEKYRGTSPFSAAETECLRDYTLKYAFDATISYHASGSLIYYEYGSNESMNAASKKLAEAIKTATGYPLEGSGSVDGAGYKDWAIDALKIPSLTIEVGCDGTPLAQRELYSIFVRNRSVLPEIARWVQS